MAENDKKSACGKAPRVLWLVSITIPQAARACGLPVVEVGGGWLTGQLCALQAAPDAPQLTICSVDARVRQPLFAAADGISYALLPTGGAEDCRAALKNARPDIVHIWGSEYAAAAAMQAAAAAMRIPALVGIQGVMADCARHLCDGVPQKYLKSCTVQRLIDRVVPGALLDKMQRSFDALAGSEAAMLAAAKYITGRTAFDKSAAARLAPQAVYYPCNETLRPQFYSAPGWQPHQFGNAPVLLMSQGNYPLKNLHTAIKVLPAVLAQYPGAVLRVAGWPPLDKGALLRPVIGWMFPYQHYCRQLAAALGVAGHIQYTGPLQADEMRQAFLGCDTFLLPSYSENSPNSLGEAMLLGVPCVAAAVGGVPDMLHEGEGILYAPAGDEKALGAALTRLLADADAAAAMGKAGQAHAKSTHCPAANAAQLISIYRHILAKEATL